jgi:hypothetical protein
VPNQEQLITCHQSETNELTHKLVMGWSMSTRCPNTMAWTAREMDPGTVHQYLKQATYINALAVSVLRPFELAGTITLGELYLTLGELGFTFHLTIFNVMFHSVYFLC